MSGKNKQKWFRIVELGFLLVLCCLCMSGCIPYPEWSDRFIGRYICGLPNGVKGNFDLTCTDGEKIYYFDDYAIYSYEGGQSELVTKLDEENDYFLDQMACTSDYLYYTRMNKGRINNRTIYRVNLHTKEVEDLDEVYKIEAVDWIVSHGEDILIRMTVAEGEKETNEILYIGGDGTAKAFPLKEKRFAATLGDYQISGKFGEDGLCLSICAGDGWQYSGGSKMIAWKAGDDIAEIYNCNISLNGKQVAVEDDIRYDGEEWYASTEPEFCSVYDDEVYLLYEYRDRDYADVDDFKGRDAIYRLNTDTGEMELVYQVDEMPTQIATYSVENGVVYLLKLDGLYRVNVDFHGTNDPSDCEEERVLKLSRKWDGISRVAFSECGGKLFVFRYGGAGTRLLKVIEQ